MSSLNSAIDWRDRYIDKLQTKLTEANRLLEQAQRELAELRAAIGRPA